MRRNNIYIYIYGWGGDSVSTGIMWLSAKWPRLVRIHTVRSSGHIRHNRAFRSPPKQRKNRVPTTWRLQQRRPNTKGATTMPPMYNTGATTMPPMYTKGVTRCHRGILKGPLRCHRGTCEMQAGPNTRWVGAEDTGYWLNTFNPTHRTNQIRAHDEWAQGHDNQGHDGCAP